MRNNITVKEQIFKTHGIDFRCTFGRHEKGGWCAVLNLGVCTELEIGNVAHNIQNICKVLENAPKRELLFKLNNDDIRDVSEYLAEQITPLL